MAANTDSEVSAVIFDEVQPRRQFAGAQAQHGGEASRNGAGFGHFQHAVAEVLAHQVGAKPVAAEEQEDSIPVTGRTDKRPGMAATGSLEDRRRLIAPGDDLADAISGAVGTGRTEHQLTLHIPWLDMRVFQFCHHERCQIGCGGLNILETGFHDLIGLYSNLVLILLNGESNGHEKFIMFSEDYSFKSNALDSLHTNQVNDNYIIFFILASGRSCS